MTGSLSDHPTQPNLVSTLDQPSPPINRQLEANRRNALRSTGPRTAAGKAVVRDNALKHGFLSRHLINELVAQQLRWFECLLQARITWMRRPWGVWVS